MFVLLEGREYEGYTVLGVYSTLDRAIEAGTAYGDAHGLRYSWVEVQEVPVDAPAEWRDDCDRAIWSLTGAIDRAFAAA